VNGLVAAAERMTSAKVAVEIRGLRTFANGVAVETLPEDQIDM
jgi:hypothetical protein